ncbi:MAG: hypothetical protein AAF399_10955 [Bacteroidota bacterium]
MQTRASKQVFVIDKRVVFPFPKSGSSTRENEAARKGYGSSSLQLPITVELQTLKFAPHALQTRASKQVFVVDKRVVFPFPKSGSSTRENGVARKGYGSSSLQLPITGELQTLKFAPHALQTRESKQVFVIDKSDF